MDVPMTSSEGLSAHDVLEANENDPSLVDRETLNDGDEYELTELKNVGAECKLDREKEDIRPDTPLEELTEQDEGPSHSSGTVHPPRYIVQRGERNVGMLGSQSNSQQSQATQQNLSQRDSFYLEQPQTVAQDVMISGYQTQRSAPTSQPPHRVMSHQSGASSSSTQQGSHQNEGRNGTSSGYYLLKTPSGGPGHVPIRIVHGSEPHSNTPRVTVVPATRSHNGTAVLQLPPGQIPSRSQRTVQIIHTPSSNGQNSSQYDHHRVNVGDPGVTVTASGTVGQGMHVVKKDGQGVPMVIDSNGYYNSGGQKVYRLVSLQDDSHMSGPPRKRMAVIAPRTTTSSQQVNMVSMTPSTSRVPMSQLNDEVIIDDGIQDRTIVIDPDVNPPDSPLLAESPGIGSMMISGHQPSMGPPSPGSHPGYLHQSQYDADLAFQQMIITCLGRYNEDDKAVMKFHIQRILLEARYGVGIAQRLLLQEDDLEGASNGVPHELVSQ